MAGPVCYDTGRDAGFVFAINIAVAGSNRYEFHDVVDRSSLDPESSLVPFAGQGGFIAR
jgi:hypothetical protein